MGVSGSGKTTVGRRLAARLGGRFLDGDDFHPEENIRKMAAGNPLVDADREPWLNRILDAIRETAEEERVVVACSALKESYRRQLAEIPYELVYLKGTETQIADRLNDRTGHFMPASLLASQFDDLEEPGDALIVPMGATVDEMVDLIVTHLSAA